MDDLRLESRIKFWIAKTAMRVKLTVDGHNSERITSGWGHSDMDDNEDVQYVDVDDRSDEELLLGEFAVDELVELFPSDSFGAIATNSVDDFHQLVVIETVLELVVDVPEVVEVELALALHIQEGKVAASAVFGEGAALPKNPLTTRTVISFRNSSKLRALPPELSLTSLRILNTSSYLESSPRVPAVMSISRASALRWRGSA